MLARFANRLLFIGLFAGAAFAPSAHATIMNTATQTLSYGPQAAGWTHVFAFSPYVDQGPGTQFNGVRLSVTGTQTTTISCLLGYNGIGNGAASCSGNYNERGSFRLTSSPLPMLTFTDPVLSQGGNSNLIETNFFSSPLTISTVSVGGSTTYRYYNAVVSSGGSLTPAAFTGSGLVNFTFDAGATGGLTAPVGAGLGLGGSAVSVADALTVSLSYEYAAVSTPEPAGLTLFGGALLGLAVVRRRRPGSRP